MLEQQTRPVELVAELAAEELRAVGQELDCAWAVELAAEQRIFVGLAVGQAPLAGVVAGVGTVERRRTVEQVAEQELIAGRQMALEQELARAVVSPLPPIPDRS